ncbi:hypothetical protein Pcinc_005389 [Petrolisthes cinctipes]|uniref:Uncharacterized protein n=1 Tax=Petrolisthes cinctipes TaxID=88211 RepID=A0AAE1L069_PETCI|nr:hypothetical protein Pcinc_005389 [Petrolisthes cinctipes]
MVSDFLQYSITSVYSIKFIGDGKIQQCRGCRGALIRAVAYVLERGIFVVLHPRSPVDLTSVGLEDSLGAVVDAARWLVGAV